MCRQVPPYNIDSFVLFHREPLRDQNKRKFPSVQGLPAEGPLRRGGQRVSGVESF